MFGCAKYMGKGFPRKSEYPVSVRKAALCRSGFRLKRAERRTGSLHGATEIVQAFFEEVHGLRRGLEDLGRNRPFLCEGFQIGAPDSVPTRTDFHGRAVRARSFHGCGKAGIEKLRRQRFRHFRLQSDIRRGIDEPQFPEFGKIFRGYRPGLRERPYVLFGKRRNGNFESRFFGIRPPDDVEPVLLERKVPHHGQAFGRKRIDRFGGRFLPNLLPRCGSRLRKTGKRPRVPGKRTFYRSSVKLQNSGNRIQEFAFGIEIRVGDVSMDGNAVSGDFSVRVGKGLYFGFSRFEVFRVRSHEIRDLRQYGRRDFAGFRYEDFRHSGKRITLRP